MVITSHDDPNAPGIAGRMLTLASMIDLQSFISVACASAVFGYMQRRRDQIFLPHDPRAADVFRVMSLEMISLDNVVYINAETLTALQIIDVESHPNMQNQGPNGYGMKESLSVYGLFHHLARTPQGKRKLRQAFIRPAKDLAAILQRQSSIRTFVHSRNLDISEAILKSLKSIRNLRPLLMNLRKGIRRGNGGMNEIKNGVWTTLRASAFHLLEIHRNMKELYCEQAIDIVSKVLELDVRRIAIIGRDITNIVDFGTSVDEGRTIIRPGVDENLDSLKRTYAGIDDLLSRLSSEIVQDFRNQAVDFYLNVVTYPQIGFLIAVQRDVLTGNFPNPPRTSASNFWDRVFCTEEVTYYKDNRMRALDRRYGDLAGHIYDREVEITLELGQRVLMHDELLCQASDMCGDLDLILALAQGAGLYSLVQPTMTTDNVIDIKGGRHILKEQVTSSFIPNDTQVRGFNTGDIDNSPFGSSGLASNSRAKHGPNMLIITGPNYSGKSVFLKQVALIVFMAHVGSFVPAESATVGLTDKILTRISTCETVSRQESAFMIDVQQIASLLRLATSRSLCIIDEFGKGTDSGNGAALACAVFKHFLKRGNDQPKVLAATHFHEIFGADLLCPTSKLALFHLEVAVDPEAATGTRVIHLYKLRPGLSDSSLGIE